MLNAGLLPVDSASAGCANFCVMSQYDVGEDATENSICLSLYFVHNSSLSRCFTGYGTLLGVYVPVYAMPIQHLHTLKNFPNTGPHW